MTTLRTVDNVLADIDAILNVKQASYRSKTAAFEQDASTQPGPEHDSAVPQEYSQPDKEIAEDKTTGPASARKMTGAGDDSPLTRGHALEIDEPAASVDEKPLISSDSNAKQAELANDILAYIRSANKPAEPVKTAASKAVKPAAQPKVAPAASNVPVSKEAGMFDLELTKEVVTKLGALMLSVDEGVELASKLLEKVAGAKAAEETLGYLEAQEFEAQKIAAARQGFEDGKRAAAGSVKTASKRELIKDNIRASLYATKTAQDKYIKIGQDIADAALGDALAQMPPQAAMPGPEAMPAPDAIPAGALEPDADELGADGDVTLEDVVGALYELVASGEISEDDAVEAIGVLLGGEEGGGALAGEMAAPEGGEAVISDMATPAPEEGDKAPESKPEAEDKPEAEAKTEDTNKE